MLSYLHILTSALSVSMGLVLLLNLALPALAEKSRRMAVFDAALRRGMHKVVDRRIERRERERPGSTQVPGNKANAIAEGRRLEL